MGCCVSTTKHPQFHQHSSTSSRAPPPVDEETVKEVLSETPNPHHFPKIQDQPTKSPPKQTPNNIPNHPIYTHEDHSFSGEVSEICSNISENISNTTFEDDSDVIRRTVVNRSPAKLRNRRTNNNNNNNIITNNNNSGELRGLRNSPARGKQQSPGRVRSGSGFGSTGRQRPSPAAGQVSRSRSPANRTVGRGGGGGGGRNGVGRSPSARKMDSSPGRVGSGLRQRGLDPDMDTGMGSGMERVEKSWDPTERNGSNDDESLDNPLVSLECFIFL